MATLITKNSSTASSIPTAVQLVQGELAVNVTDKRLFTENSAGAVVELGTNPSSITTSSATITGGTVNNTVIGATTPLAGSFTNAAYTLSLTGGTGVVNLGSGQFYKDVSGNVGIGTSSPAEKLHVSSASVSSDIISANTNSGISSNNKFGFSIYESNSEVASFRYFRDGTGNAQLTGSSTLLFDTNGSERARINSSGNLLVGTTSTSYGSFSGRVVSNASSGGAGLFYTSYSGDLSNAALSVGKFDNNGTTSQVYVRFGFNNGGLGGGQINGNGSGAAAFGGFSDRRLKENIVDLPPQLDNILSLRPVEFDYIESAGGGHQTGFVAQEIQEIYPDVVGAREPDGMLTVTGWSKTEARLVKAIQEQQAMLVSLKAIVDEQAVKIAALEAK